MSTLHIQLLGEFRLADGDTQKVNSATALNSPRMQSLLAYLLLHRHAPQSRRHLAFLFWPTSSESQAYSNLRKLFHQLRQALPQPDQFLQYDNLTIQWQANAPVHIDIDKLDQALKAIAQTPLNLSLLNHAVELYTGTLLPACYDDWIIPLRQRYQREIENVLAQLVAALENQQAYAEGARYAQQLLDLDPLEETSYQRLMRLRSLRGDHAGALRVYYDCVRTLKREFGVEPGSATQQIYLKIVNSTQPVETPALSPPTIGGSGLLVSGTPLVGRGEAWHQVRAAWQKAVQGAPHMLVIAGEPGIGKTRLAEELLVWVKQQGALSAHTRSYAAQGELAYAPISELLRAPALRPRLNKLSDLWLTEVARLLPELLTERPTLVSPGPLTESWQRQRFFEAVARAFLVDDQPLLLLLDDLQWCNEETLRWLHFLLHFAPQARLLLVGTLRSEEVDHNHPMHVLQLGLQRSEQWAEVALLPFNQEEVTTLAQQMSSVALSVAEAEQLYRVTEGNPLFVVETIRAGNWRSEATQPLVGEQQPFPHDPALALPPKVYATVRTRLDQLSAQAQELASIAGVIGRSFTFALLAAVSKQEEGGLLNSLDELWQRRIIREQGANSYDFSHDRIREVSYATISRTRQRLLHQRVAEAFETLYADRLNEVSGQLAEHCVLAGQLEKAQLYYQQAAETARQIHANVVAIRHCQKALALLAQLPGTVERSQRQLALLVSLGLIYVDSKGKAAPEVEQTFLAAKQLIQDTDSAPELLPILFGLTECYRVRAEYDKAHDMGQQLFRLAQAKQAIEYMAKASFQLGVIAFNRGQLPEARRCLEQANQYQATQQINPKFMVEYANVLWNLGYPEQALTISKEMLVYTQTIERPHQAAEVLAHMLELHFQSGDVENLSVDNEKLLTLANTHDFAQLLSWATYLQGWERVLRGDEAGIMQVQRGLASYLATGGRNGRSRYLIWLGEMAMKVDQMMLATRFLDEAEQLMQQIDERYWEAELYRLRGDWLRSHDSDQQLTAERLFQRALEVARQQQAKSLELRAATSLAQLWQQQGRRADAYTLLAEIYGWFSEGFSLRDWREARSLLTMLA